MLPSQIAIACAPAAFLLAGYLVTDTRLPALTPLDDQEFFLMWAMQDMHAESSDRC